MAKYGMPYQGSKSRIAEWVVDIMPPSHTLVDLFAGGCAITHCALLSGKWGRIIANDITDTVEVFQQAINGELDGYATVPTREEFLANKDTDTLLAILYSFGNDKTTYLWAPEIEAFKRPASLMVSAPSMAERRKWYRSFCKALLDYLGGTEKPNRIWELEGLERIEGLQGLRGASGDCVLVPSSVDYRLVDIPEGATVYADPPYRGTANSARYGAFDFDAFDAWLNGVDFPVFVSEFDAPEGCVEIARTEKMTSMAATGSSTVVEKIYVQERFYDQCKPKTLFDSGLE